MPMLLNKEEVSKEFVEDIENLGEDE